VNDFSIRLTRRTSIGDRTHEETVDLDLGQLQQLAPPQPTKSVSWSESPAVYAAPKLEWSPTLCDGKRVNYADAEKACAALGEGWRLPTRMELESILDLTRHDPAVDTTRFPDTKSGWYWSSTPCAWSSDDAWVVSFYDGYASDYRRDDYGAFVRAVRGVPAGQ
jgi:hypothetical protein